MTGRSYEVTRTDSEWRRILTAEQYQVLRHKGTERAHTGKYNAHKDAGSYLCAGCGQQLFHSTDKYDSGSGWPSFVRPVADAIREHRDDSHSMARTEVTCSRCGGHLGHVFPDGPAPTGQRYCVNSASLTFRAGETNR
ncbi:MAG: peptide-methionine (R)-S-oxide reductase MsrB [bacterium]